MNEIETIRAAIRSGDWNTVRILASANGNMHDLWNLAMDAQFDGMVNVDRMIYALSRYERFEFC